jgi:hypothetical protein
MSAWSNSGLFGTAVRDGSAQLAALVEKRGVVFVCFNHKVAGRAGRADTRSSAPPIQKTGLQAGAFSESMRAWRWWWFAMGASHCAERASLQQFPASLRPAHVGCAAVQYASISGNFAVPSPDGLETTLPTTNMSGVPGS